MSIESKTLKQLHGNYTRDNTIKETIKVNLFSSGLSSRIKSISNIRQFSLLLHFFKILNFFRWSPDLFHARPVHDCRLFIAYAPPP